MKNEKTNEMLNKILEQHGDVLLLTADGFDEAILGFTNDDNPKLIYSVSKCIHILENEHEMTTGEAFEYFTFNVSGAYMGEKTPIWCWDIY